MLKAKPSRSRLLGADGSYRSSPAIYRHNKKVLRVKDRNSDEVDGLQLLCSSLNAELP